MKGRIAFPLAMLALRILSSSLKNAAKWAKRERAKLILNQISAMLKQLAQQIPEFMKEVRK